MTLTISPIYAALGALLFIVLSWRVILLRRDARISLGAGDDAELLTRTRVHGNCAEYLPLGLILLVMVELMAAPALAVHALGVILIAGRVLHAYGVSKSPQIMGLRVAGMLLTFTMLALSALGLLLHAIL